MKKVIIIGAGPGGLTSGLILAKNGYDVRIYEKQNYVGGRNSEIKLGDYHFDMGPTFFLMKDYIEEIFKKVGLNLHDFIELQKIEPMYRLYFNENTIFYPYNDKEKMLKEIKRVFPGEENGYLKYLEKEQKKYERLIGCLQIPYSKISDFFKKQFIKALPFLDAHVSLYDVLGRYFNNEFLKLSFTFQAKYIGMSPFEAPGTFSIISYLEHAFGIYHIKGGLNKINHAMADIIKENNGKIYLNNGVKELIIENGEAKGILLENGEKDFADYVIINADFAHAMTHIVNKKDIQKYKKEKLDKKTYSCSTFMLYLGVNKVYDNIPHHSILFSGDYRKNVKEITTTLQLSDDPSIYVQNASITDDTLAPKGKSTIYILVPVPNNFSNIDWEKEKFKFREKVLDLVEKRGGFSDLRNHIEEKLMFTPKEWEEKIYVYKGATFNLGHNISQMLIFRPHNEFEEFKNCYLVGGGTHPGSGLPTIYESARISTDLILKRDKVK